jgi:hypothetical protein
MDIADWLRGLGLEQYEGAFRENAIDAQVLRDLTAEDLRELGVSLIGHRRRLLKAIADLRAEAAGPAESPQTIGSSAAEPGHRPQHRHDRISDASADQQLAEPRVRIHSPPAGSLQTFGS